MWELPSRPGPPHSSPDRLDGELGFSRYTGAVPRELHKTTHHRRWDTRAVMGSRCAAVVCGQLAAEQVGSIAYGSDSVRMTS